MKKSNQRFLSGLVVLCTFCITNAFAVPSVKMLGTNTARVGVNSSTVKQDAPTKVNTVSTPQRLGSIRAQNATTGTLSNRVSGASVSSDSNRLGFKIGPYMQVGTSVSNPAKAPAIQPAQPVVQKELNAGDWILIADDTVSLDPEVTDRIVELEDTMPKKQNKLRVGEGLILEDDELTLVPTIAQIPDQLTTLQETINNKVSNWYLMNNYYSRQELNEMLRDGGIVYTGQHGIRVVNEQDARHVQLDIDDPQPGTIYVFKDDRWVALPVKYEWDPMN